MKASQLLLSSRSSNFCLLTCIFSPRTAQLVKREVQCCLSLFFRVVLSLRLSLALSLSNSWGSSPRPRLTPAPVPYSIAPLRAPSLSSFDLSSQRSGDSRGSERSFIDFHHSQTPHLIYLPSVSVSSGPNPVSLNLSVAELALVRRLTPGHALLVFAYSCQLCVEALQVQSFKFPR